MPREALAARLTDAALAGALLTSLAAQELRHEGYETEKVALLAIFGAVLFAAFLLRFANRQARGTLRRIDPVTVGVSALILVSVVATLTSLSPSLSLWGSANRAQGLLTLLLYVLIFAHAAAAGARIMRWLIPLIAVMTGVICAFAILMRFNLGIERPGSLMGHANFMAAWLIMAAPLIAAPLYLRLRARPEGLQDRGLTGLLAVALLLIMVALALASSRGALVALAAAGLSGVVLWAVLTGRRRLLLATGGVVLIAVLGYGVIALALGERTATESGIARLFRPVDDFRLVTWGIGVDLVTRQAEPYLDSHDQPDELAALRPLIGYGPDTVTRLQSRFGAVYGETIFLDTFHNQGFDALLTTGVAGLSAWLLIYAGGVYVALRALGLVSRRRLLMWLLALISGGAVGAVVLTALIPDARFGALLPAGFALGAIAGLLVWLASRAAPRAAAPAELSVRSVWIITLVSIVVARCIDNQFGFVQTASEPLWWLSLGLLVALARSQPDDTTLIPAPTAQAWYLAALITGGVVIYTLGVSIDSQYVRHAAAVAEWPLLLAVALIVGAIGAWSAGTAGLWWHSRWIARVIGVWIGFALLDLVISHVAARLLDQTLVDSSGTLLALQIPFMILALKGVGAACLVIVAGVRLHPPQPQTVRWRSAALLIAALWCGMGYYTLNYTGATLHGVGNQFAEFERIDALNIALRVHEAGQTLPPPLTQRTLDQARAWLRLAAQTPDDPLPLATANQQLEGLFARDPFYVNSRLWALFNNEYAAAVGVDALANVSNSSQN
ncbi:MAG: hypothetical protein GYB67_10380 [Chloroflexi bacterium]|nr:hypothetical protein [Chloroflexota bacterium]